MIDEKLVEEAMSAFNAPGGMLNLRAYKTIETRHDIGAIKAGGIIPWTGRSVTEACRDVLSLAEALGAHKAECIERVAALSKSDEVVFYLQNWDLELSADPGGEWIKLSYRGRAITMVRKPVTEIDVHFTTPPRPPFVGDGQQYPEWKDGRWQ